jgi:hypothetical protein
MGAGSVGEGSSVNVAPVGVGLTGSVAAGHGVTVAGLTIPRGNPAGGMGGGIGVDVGAEVMKTGVGEAPPHPLKRDITMIITIPHLET